MHAFQAAEWLVQSLWYNVITMNIASGWHFTFMCSCYIPSFHNLITLHRQLISQNDNSAKCPCELWICFHFHITQSKSMVWGLRLISTLLHLAPFLLTFFKTNWGGCWQFFSGIESFLQVLGRLLWGHMVCWWSYHSCWLSIWGLWWSNWGHAGIKQGQC